MPRPHSNDLREALWLRLRPERVAGRWLSGSEFRLPLW